jgi:hypothetical protein
MLKLITFCDLTLQNILHDQQMRVVILILIKTINGHMNKYVKIHHINGHMNKYVKIHHIMDLKIVKIIK